MKSASGGYGELGGVVPAWAMRGASDVSVPAWAGPCDAPGEMMGCRAPLPGEPELETDPGPLAMEPMIPAAMELPPPDMSAIRAEIEQEFALREQEYQARIEQLAAQMDAALAARRELATRLESEAIRAAMVIAGRAIGHAVEAEPELLGAWAKEALVAAGFGEQAEVAVPSESVTCLAELSSETRIVIDEELQPGTCEVREGARVVSVGAQARLRAIAEHLGLDEDALAEVA